MALMIQMLAFSDAMRYPHYRHLIVLWQELSLIVIVITALERTASSIYFLRPNYSES